MLFLGQIAGAPPVTQPMTNAQSNRQLHEGPPRSALYGRTASSQKAAFRRSAAFPRGAWYQVGRWLMAAYTRVMLDVDVRWHSPLPEGPKILAPNHPTTTDPLYLLPLLAEPVSFLVTAASFDVPVVGAYLRAAGHLPAVRGSGGATVDAMVRQVEAGRSVAIFPEGALSPLAGGFHRPHSGVARLALQTGAPEVPVGIGVQPERIHVTEAAVQGENAVGHLYTSGPYAITVGRSLTFAGDAQDRARVRAVADQVMQHVRTLADESQARAQRAQGAQAGTRSAPARSAGVADAPAVR